MSRPGPEGSRRAAASDLPVDEQAGLTVGADGWTSRALPERGIPSVRFADGPHGVRKTHEGNEGSLFDSLPATCFPSSSALGSTWNRGLVREIGIALGEEAAGADVDVLLAPGLNLKRSPVGGRNFEYFSEDPLVTSELGVSYVEGLQSTGVGASVKHFVANDTENRRYGIDVRVDDRALRELYLAAFERPIRRARPATVMAAYSRLNGIHCTENGWLLKTVLRGEWGYDGAVISDWGASWDRRLSVPGGLDLEMPGVGGSHSLIQAARKGNVRSGDLARAAGNVAKLARRAKPRAATADLSANHELARRAAADATVLLQNNDAVLPIEGPATPRIAVIGAFADVPRYQGAGSSHVVPTQLTTLLASLRELAGGVTISYAPGYDREGHGIDEDLLRAATAAADDADVAVVVAGLPEAYETEGVDRPHLKLPPAHDELVRRVATANPRTIVVLQNGSPVEMPWRDQVSAILETHLGGQAGGAATAEILLGMREPGGRLAETYPITFEDHPVAHITGESSQLEYWESIYVGYRYFDSTATRVAFPFGHGRSYTSFSWSEAAVDHTPESSDGPVTVSVRVTNTGDRRGADVVQVYVAPIDEGTVFRAEQQLAGFEKVELESGASALIAVEVDPRAFRTWDVASGRWMLQPGRYEVRIAASSRDVRASETITIAGARATRPDENAYRSLAAGHQFTRDAFAGIYTGALPANLPAQSGHYTLDTSLQDMTGSPLAGALFRAVRAQAIKTLGVPDDESQRQVLDGVVGQFTLRMLPTISGGAFAKWQVAGLLNLINLTSRRTSARSPRSERGTP